MSCEACSKRQQVRIVPVRSGKQPAERSTPNKALTKGEALRSKLRYTGR